MSEFSEAFTELQTEFADVLGAPQKVKIDGEDYDAIIEDVNSDEIQVFGGIAESGGFRAMVACALLPVAPAQLSTIEGRGKEFQILNITNTNGVTWTLVCGDPASE